MDSVVERCLKHAEWLEMQGPDEVPGGLLLPKEDAKAIRMLVERLAAKDARIAELKAMMVPLGGEAGNIVRLRPCPISSDALKKHMASVLSLSSTMPEAWRAGYDMAMHTVTAWAEATERWGSKAAAVSPLHSSLSAAVEAAKKMTVALAEAAAQVKGNQHDSE